jgi:hypothetical protein
MRAVIAKIVLSFDISLAEGEDGKELFGQCEDHFTLAPGPLRVVFSERDP